MPRILVAECKQEVSSFNPVPSLLTDFETLWGSAFLDYHRGLNSEMAGALAVFAARSDVELVPAYSARSITSGGTLAAEDFSHLATEFLALVKTAGPVDAVYYSLHGAMAAANESDPEGFLLAETRKIVGERIPIVISLDLHGILTDQMLRHTDAVVVYHTYPHVDFASTGARAARLLLRILDGEASPITAVVPIPALVRGNELITETGLFGQMIRYAKDIEDGPGGLSVGMFIGNPFTDVPELRSNSLVVLDGDAARAEREALKLAQDFWAVRQQLHQPLIGLSEAVERTLANPSGTVILTDAADATSSGASGDSNAILAALMQRGYTGSLLTPIVDPGAVVDAMAAGVGATIRTTLGGGLDRRRFRPLPVTAQVRMLSDGDFVSESNGAVWRGGPTAVLQVGRHIVVATSRPVSLYDRSLFYGHGQDPTRFDVVVVKSPHCQPHFFNTWAAQTLHVDAPGSTSANLPYLGHTVCARPIFPLDPAVVFEPKAVIYRRGA
ncbi:MAG: M81 family metallopeptidase [Chloroflexi bacterium]|nr:M81 family metallopeptidase [Chloroflexota bacterium]